MCRYPIRTLNFSNSTGQDFLLSLLLLKAGNDLLDDGLGEVGLFSVLHLLLVAYPAVKYSLELGAELDLLELDEVLGLENSSFLMRCALVGHKHGMFINTYLRESEEALSDGNNILHLSNGVNTLLNSTGVLSAGIVQDLLDACNVAFCPLRVRLAYDLES